ncbi:sensor histidine kinase [Agromyces sp. SYSU T00194]|uniref:sensor histidine kinase n=1 Tax=Agromyces chitinivorans TaxID=3158560 RepID=UPI003398C882
MSTPATTTAAPASQTDGDDWVRPWPGPRSLRADALGAAVLAAGTAVSLVLSSASGVYEDAAPVWASVLWLVAMTAPLVVRRLVPEVAAVVVSAAYMVGIITQVAELLFSQIIVFVAIYTVGAWGRRRALANLTRGVIVAAMFVWLFWNLIVYSNVADYLPALSREFDGLLSPYVAFGLIQIITNLLYFGGAWYFGDSAHRAARERAALAQRTEELAAERQRTARQAVALERVRIARELHDVVAHHVSVMGVQAGAARRVLERDPALATANLQSVEASAREAVDELHRLLGTLRADEVDEASAAAPPAEGTSTLGAAQLPQLAAESARAGLPTEFRAVGEERPLPAVVDLTVYRIAQEALTNARKHGGGAARADVRLRYLDDAVELEVVNSGLARAAAATPGRGLGQVGMRERAASVGGEVEFGPRARGGYLVRARLPLHPPAVPAAAEDGR